ncbi:MAG: glycoside hydrolase family 3 C-terminal domain-containing protein, partial [Clostridia bacterium]|nr:glycoside hydrolase family 3 C-terminal domain-containing protein [Clostridia bacterium]
RLLQEILKDKIGFAGFIMSDWWAINTDSYENFGNGMDMNMPGGPGWTPEFTNKDGSWWSKIPDWINSGSITQDRVDDAARRIIAAMYKVNLLSGKTLTDDDLYPKYVKLDAQTRSSETEALNRQVGQESIVLLKNEGNFLPLNNNKVANPTYSTLKIFGNSADESECLGVYDCTCKGDNSTYELGESTRYFTGYVGLGWGSGTTHFQYQVTPLAAITAKAQSLSKTVTSSTSLTGNYSTGFKEVLPTAATDCANINIVFIAANSGEEYIKVEGLVGDRTTLDAWHDGTQLVDAVLGLCNNIVLVILGPATVTIKEDWKTSTKIKAILFGGMLGAEGGNAIADVLFGEVVPSGHLTFVWAPQNSYPNVTKTTTLTENEEYIKYDYNYEEGLFVGQRYVDKYDKPFDYPFGFGLSYTSFEFSDLALTMNDNGLTVKFKVKNVGKYDGKVVPMIFLKFPIDNYPEKVLKGFEKKAIKSGETETFEILIEPHDLSYYNVNVQDFVRPESKYTVYVGENARDNKLTGTVGGDTEYKNVDERWVDLYKKADNFLKDFTLDDKVMLLYSYENLQGKCVGSIEPNKDRNFPGLCLQDGPAGVRLAKNTQHW